MMFRFLRFIFRGERLAKANYRRASDNEIMCQDCRWYHSKPWLKDDWHCFWHDCEKTHKCGTCDIAEEKPEIRGRQWKCHTSLHKTAFSSRIPEENINNNTEK